jgi:hypothetical protein
VKIYVVAMEVLRENERGDEILSLLPKLLEKLVWVFEIFGFVKIFIPCYVFDGLLCQN